MSLYKYHGGKRVPLTPEEEASVRAEWALSPPLTPEQRADRDAEEKAMELGKWLERKARNDRALALPGLRTEIREALVRLNEKAAAEINSRDA